MLAVSVFVYLQLLDYLTTMVGFNVGAGEASPFIAKLIHLTTPAVGVALSKVTALAIGGVCVASGRIRIVTWINYWYAGLIVWNLSIILHAIARTQH